MTEILQVCQGCGQSGGEIQDGFHYRCRLAVAESEPTVEGLSAPAFPFDALVGPAGDLVRALVPQTEAPASFLWMDLLTCIGCAIGPSPYIYQGGRQPLRLFTLMVGPTGAGRKGTSRGLVSEVFEELNPDMRVMSGISSGEGLIEAVCDPWKDKSDKFTGGYTDKRLLVVDEEFTRTHTVAHRSGSAVGPVLRQAWDWRNLANPKTEAKVATKPHICAIAHITGEELAHVAAQVDIHNGFLNRYAMVWGERSKKLPRADRPSGYEITSAVSALRKALPGARAIPQFRWSDAAALMWDEVYLADENPGGVVGALVQRKLPYISRLAAILSASVVESVVSLSSIKAAYLTWQYIEGSTSYIVNTYNLGSSRGVEKGLEMAESRRSADRTERLYKALAVANYEGLTRSQITGDVYKRNVPSSEIDSLLALLVAQGSVVREQTRGRGGKGGMSERVWLSGFGPKVGS